jgi:hypothetical protein
MAVSYVVVVVIGHGSRSDINSPPCRDWMIALPVNGDDRLHTGSSVIDHSCSGVFHIALCVAVALLRLFSV